MSLNLPKLLYGVIAIVEGDYQLIHSMEGGGFSLFPVLYQVLEVIWQSLVEAMV